jgi:hypothetical protein
MGPIDETKHSTLGPKNGTRRPSSPAPRIRSKTFQNNPKRPRTRVPTTKRHQVHAVLVRQEAWRYCAIRRRAATPRGRLHRERHMTKRGGTRAKHSYRHSVKAGAQSERMTRERRKCRTHQPNMPSACRMALKLPELTDPHKTAPSPEPETAAATTGSRRELEMPRNQTPRILPKYPKHETQSDELDRKARNAQIKHSPDTRMRGGCHECQAAP